MTINRGSEWRKWDLHVHTPTSYDYKDKSITNSEIIDEIEKNNLSVVAITDHHIIDIERIIELQKLGAEKNITIFPGIEFLSDSRGEEPIHFIAIFSEDCNLDFVWKQIESKTSISRIQGEGKAHNEVYCNLLETTNLIKELGGLVTIHAGNKTNGIENITHSLPHGVAQKEDIAKAIDIFEMGKESDCEGYRKFVIPYLIKKIQKNIPLIICSDNHKIKEYSVKQNLWIKAHPTFEGLKQILHEPNQRAYIQESKPDQKDKKLLITEVSFISENHLFASKTIYFNDNLNVIIGGKSSGKSILLYHIAKALYKDRSNEGVLKYFDTTDSKYKFFYDDFQNEFSFNLNVKLASGLEQSSEKNDEEPSILPEIKYIPQNHLSNLVDRSKKNGSTLKELIKELILENDDNDTFKTFDANIDANNIEKSKDIDVFFDIKNKMNALQKDLQDKGSKDILLTSIKSKSDEILDLQKDISEENKALYNQYNEEIQKLANENKKIVSDYSILKSLNQKIKISLDQLLTDKDKLIETLENEEIKAEFTPKYNFIQNSLDEFYQIEKLLVLNENNVLINESSIKNQLLINNQKKIELQVKIKPLVGQKESQEKIEALQNNIQQEQEKLDFTIKIENQITEYTNELVKQKEKIFSRIEDNFNQYQKVITDLEPITKNIEHKDNDEIDIEGFTKFNFKKFKESIDNITDLRKLKAQNPFEYLYDNNLNNLSPIDKATIIDDLKNVFEIIHTGNYPLIKDFNIKEACRILLENHFFDHWEVKAGSDTIHNMSTGKASFVLLKLIIKLSKSEAPILIDQPEDNLDNRSISTELVNYLRDKKLHRQIILVTHNANIVVNADAENIIIANQKDENNKNDISPYKFDYINGSLEETKPKIIDKIRFLDSMGIREHIAEIVEGGKEAFKKREEKYGF
jgi:hypothetical protein